jgi:hypothetical protein
VLLRLPPNNIRMPAHKLHAVYFAVGDRSRFAGTRVVRLQELTITFSVSLIMTRDKKGDQP